MKGEYVLSAALEGRTVCVQYTCCMESGGCRKSEVSASSGLCHSHSSHNFCHKVLPQEVTFVSVRAFL